ncbi:MAG: hypothetical protein KAV87_38670 [Desulfobacteraceae bacterium]|nr:hypothetical protein [Desulfobacteraceae bacterium]
MIFDATPGDEHIRLYSPHHNSGIEIGKSVKQWTTSSSEDWTVGNAIEGHAGTKTEFCAGWVFEGSLGFSIEAFAGFKHELLLGSSHEWVLGYSWDYVFGPSVISTRSDSLLTARYDVILGAGDEYCLAAGTQEPDEGNKNKSIMRATPDGVTLSLGDELTECGEGVGDGDWYEKKTDKWPYFGDEERLALFSLIMSFLAYGTAAGSICAGINRAPGASAILGVTAAGLSVASIAANISLAVEVLSDEKIEPVNHIDPGAKIWLHRNGTVGMVSTRGKDNQTDGEKGRIVIGVNKQEKSKKKNWQFYDEYYDFRDKEISKLVKVARPIAMDKSQPKNERRDAIKGLKGIKTSKSLGNGSNIILEKKNIRFRVGDPKDDESKAKRQIVTIGEYGENKNGVQIMAGESSIEVKRGGAIRVDSTNDIDLFSEDTVYIKGDKHVMLQSKTGGVSVKGAIKHKNWEVLA